MATEKDDNVEVYPAVEPGEDKIYRLAEAAASVIPAGQQMLHSLIASPIQKGWKHGLNKQKKNKKP